MKPIPSLVMGNSSKLFGQVYYLMSSKYSSEKWFIIDHVVSSPRYRDCDVDRPVHSVETNHGVHRSGHRFPLHVESVEQEDVECRANHTQA